MIDTAATLLSKQSLDTSSTEFVHTAILGWMIELLQAFFLVSDDIMDASHTRRGQPCWYLQPDVGMIAINDAFMLEGAIYILLKKHFRQHPAYIDFLEIFHEVTFQTECGQECDLITAPEDKVDLSQFSMQKYIFIVQYKTAFYSFYLPVALALMYCGKASKQNLQQAKDVLIPMGEYFQVQDDYLDAYADPKVLGKIGTDIQDNKCGWLINQALQRVNSEQRKVLDENYGKKDKDCEKRVKEVYAELRLDKVYAQYEEEVVGRMNQMIASVDESEGLKRNVFEEFLRKIYKRSK